MQPLTISLQDEALILLPEKALYWPRARTLLVADLHIGKCAAFRQAGIPISLASSAHDLQVLLTITERMGAERLIILGDFFHSNAAQTVDIKRLLTEWREQCQSLHVELIEGNHDKHAGKPDAALNITILNNLKREIPFLLSHDVEIENNLYTLAGHVHPVIKLYGAGQDKLRLPCFYFARDYGLLPSFGYFTGGFAINNKIKAAQVYAVADDTVIKIY